MLPIRERGIALITAVLVVAIAAIIATAMMSRQNFDTRRTANIIHRDQAIAYALGAEYWAGIELSKDAKQNKFDHLQERWAYDVPPLPIDGGYVNGKLEDLQGRFNVNNLIDTNGQVDQAYLEQYQRLLAALALDPAIADATVDWLDPDQDETIPNGAEDPMYTGFVPAYRTADRPISNITELAAVNGMDRISFEILLPHVTALPGRTAINVNTATVQVLQSLGPNIDLSTAEGLVEVREGGGFADISGTFAPLVAPDLAQAGFSETSEFFQLKAVVQIDTVRVSLFTVFYRVSGSGEVTPILRSLGTI